MKLVFWQLQANNLLTTDIQHLLFQKVQNKDKRFTWSISAKSFPNLLQDISRNVLLLSCIVVLYSMTKQFNSNKTLYIPMVSQYLLADLLKLDANLDICSFTECKLAESLVAAWFWISGSEKAMSVISHPYDVIKLHYLDATKMKGILLALLHSYDACHTSKGLNSLAWPLVGPDFRTNATVYMMLSRFIHRQGVWLSSSSSAFIWPGLLLQVHASTQWPTTTFWHSENWYIDSTHQVHNSMQWHCFRA